MHKLEAASRCFLATLEAQQQASRPEASPANEGTSASAGQLIQLDQARAPTDEEFTAAKAHLLGGWENPTALLPRTP